MTPNASVKPFSSGRGRSKSVGVGTMKPEIGSKSVGEDEYGFDDAGTTSYDGDAQLELPFANYRVVKSNLFVEARYDWSTQMHRIIMMAAAQLRIADTEFGKQRIYIRDLAALADINSGQIYEEAEKACRALLEQGL